MNRSQLKQLITETEEQIRVLNNCLKDYKGQLNNTHPTIEEAIPGDKLEDGWIVVEKYSDAALLAAPNDTERFLRWKNRNKVLEGLPGDCFIPSVEHLMLAHKNAKQHFLYTHYWSSAEASATDACSVSFSFGSQLTAINVSIPCVRAFRLVVF